MYEYAHTSTNPGITYDRVGPHYLDFGYTPHYDMTVGMHQIVVLLDRELILHYVDKLHSELNMVNAEYYIYEPVVRKPPYSSNKWDFIIPYEILHNPSQPRKR